MPAFSAHPGSDIMPLDADFRKRLRGIGHRLNPVVTVAAKGLTEGVYAEAERALSDHELIKVRFSIADRVERGAAIMAFCEHTGAQSVQEIGKIALVYRHNPDADPRLSNLRQSAE
jgi:RNA-binding protein